MVNSCSTVPFLYQEAALPTGQVKDNYEFPKAWVKPV